MLYAIVAVIILIIDQAVKYWTTVNIVLNTESKPFIPGFIELLNVHNNGAAFGILENARWFFIILTLVFTVVIIVLLSRNIIKGKLGRWMLVLVMAGGLGNCIDRIINGYVVDMFNLQFMNFAVFNVADIFVTICGTIFCIYLIFHKEPEDEIKEVPQRVPSSRPLPNGSGQPLRNTDYISQLKRPVVEGRRNIEAEMATKRAESVSTRQSESSLADWNTPVFEDSAVTAPAEKPVSQPITPRSNVIEEPVKRPSPSVKKNDSDFSLEDIIAEFKDK